MCIGIKPMRMKRIKPRDLNPEILNLIIDGVRSDDVRSNLKMAATVSNQKILNDDETVDGGLMDPCRRGENADSEISSDVRREKIGERMKYLQDLVPGCSKIVGKGERLNKIIKYVQSLETRVKFLVAVRFSPDFNIDSFFAKEVKNASQSPITNKELTHNGQATDSHSLAERVRRENIRDRLEYLEDLVPGCNRIKGCVGRLNIIIDYIEYLQEKVELLLTKLAAVNPSFDFNIDSFFAKEVFPASKSMEFDAPDNGAHLGRPYQSGPNSEKKDMREQLSEECLTKSVLSFDDTTKQKSLPDLRTLTPLLSLFLMVKDRNDSGGKATETLLSSPRSPAEDNFVIQQPRFDLA